MRKFIIIIFAVSILASCMYKKGSGNIISQTRETSPFTGVDVGGGFEVEIKNGPSEKVVVEADDNLINNIEVKVINNELHIRLEKISVNDAHLKIFVTAPQINNVNASAGSEVTVKDELKSAGTISVSASSGSNIKSAMDAPEIKAEVSSGGELTLSGRTKDLRATCSSGSSIAASELLSENSYVTVSSGGSVHIYASVSIDATASSGGNVTYRGAAPVVKKSESSGGEVEKEN